MQGTVTPGMRMRLMQTGSEFDVVEVGTFRPGYSPCDALYPGDVGYVSASIKDVADTRVGDTITDAARPADRPLPGYRKVTPMVFCGIYPADGADYDNLRDALEKLRMNDASLSFDPETSVALGYGFRCGFLGLLHMEIIQQRLEREFDLDLVTTAPSVIYHVFKTDGTEISIDNPSNLPPAGEIARMEEPYVTCTLYTPQEFVGAMMDICVDKRGIFIDMQYEGGRVKLIYEIPSTRSSSSSSTVSRAEAAGTRASDYELKGLPRERAGQARHSPKRRAVRRLLHHRAQGQGRQVPQHRREAWRRHSAPALEIPIRAAIGGKIIARNRQGHAQGRAG